jgi:hypothetical protein
MSWKHLECSALRHSIGIASNDTKGRSRPTHTVDDTNPDLLVPAYGTGNSVNKPWAGIRVADLDKRERGVHAASVGGCKCDAGIEGRPHHRGGQCRPQSRRAGRNRCDRDPRERAIEFDKRMASAVASGRHSDAIDFLSLGVLAQMAHPTYDHFLPFLYSLGLVDPRGPVQTFCEGFQWPGISMRSFVLA